MSMLQTIGEMSAMIAAVLLAATLVIRQAVTRRAKQDTAATDGRSILYL